MERERDSHLSDDVVHVQRTHSACGTTPAGFWADLVPDVHVAPGAGLPVASPGAGAAHAMGQCRICPEFFIRSAIPSVVALLAVAWVRRCGWLRPATAPVLSWESVLYEYVRWPWMAIGIGHAVIGRLTGRELDVPRDAKRRNGGASGPSAGAGSVFPHRRGRGWHDDVGGAAGRGNGLRVPGVARRG